MGTDQIMYCIVALILGMLMFHMLKGVCGCKLVEGVPGTAPAPASENFSGKIFSCLKPFSARPKGDLLSDMHAFESPASNAAARNWEGEEGGTGLQFWRDRQQFGVGVKSLLPISTDVLYSQYQPLMTTEFKNFPEYEISSIRAGKTGKHSTLLRNCMAISGNMVQMVAPGDPGYPVNCAVTCGQWGACNANKQHRTCTVTQAQSGGGDACPDSPAARTCTQAAWEATALENAVVHPPEYDVHHTNSQSELNALQSDRAGESGFHLS